MGIDDVRHISEIASLARTIGPSRGREPEKPRGWRPHGPKVTMVNYAEKISQSDLVFTGESLGLWFSNTSKKGDLSSGWGANQGKWKTTKSEPGPGLSIWVSSKTILFLLFIRGFTTPGWIDLQKVDCLLLSFLSISSEMQLSTLVAPADYTKAGTFDAARDLDDVI